MGERNLMKINKMKWMTAAFRFDLVSSEENTYETPFMRAFYTFSEFINYVCDGFYCMRLFPRFQIIRVYDKHNKIYEISYKDYNKYELKIEIYIHLALDFYDNVINKEKEDA